MNTAVNPARLKKPAKLIQRGKRSWVVENPVQRLLIHARSLHNACRHLRPACNSPFIITDTIEPGVDLINEIAVEP